VAANRQLAEIQLGVEFNLLARIPKYADCSQRAFYTSNDGLNTETRLLSSEQ